MKTKLLLFLAVIAALHFALRAEEKDPPPKEVIYINKGDDEDDTIPRSMPYIPIHAEINFATQQIEVTFDSPTPNTIISVIRAGGTTTATQNASMLLQTILPLPQLQGDYTLFIDANGTEYSGDFDL